jgi:hypothetical protein
MVWTKAKTAVVVGLAVVLSAGIFTVAEKMAHSRPAGLVGEPAVNFAGTWKWVAPANPDGRIPEITFSLESRGETLTGTVNKGADKADIINGVVKNDEVSFQTVREGKARKTTTTYSGKLNGDTIKGHVAINAGGKELGPKDWEAARAKD